MTMEYKSSESINKPSMSKRHARMRGRLSSESIDVQVRPRSIFRFYSLISGSHGCMICLLVTESDVDHVFDKTRGINVISLSVP